MVIFITDYIHHIADRLGDRARCYTRDAYASFKKQRKEDKKREKQAAKQKKKDARDFAKQLAGLKMNGKAGASLAPSTMGDTSDTVTEFPDEDRQFEESDDEKDQKVVQSMRSEGWRAAYNANGGPDVNPVGPWHPDLNDTMFWM
jgi:hypothetical protein